METYNVLEARNHLSQLVARAQAGEEIVISRRGVPAARLVPVEPPKSAMTGREFAAWLKDNIHISGGRTREDVDAYLREERDSWGD